MNNHFIKKLLVGFLIVLGVLTEAADSTARSGEDGSWNAGILNEYSGALWVGGENGGLVWWKDHPAALVWKTEEGIQRRNWGDGTFFRLNFADGHGSASNLDYPAPLINTEENRWRFTWKASEKVPVDLTVMVSVADGGRRISFEFTITNRGTVEITSLTLPCGWPEVPRTGAEFILPAWVGAAIPLEGMAPVSMVSPGQLHSQWFGLCDPSGGTWMLRSDDTEYNLKSLGILADNGEVRFSWSHELWLKPGATYRGEYRTILELMGHGDWNDMTSIYRDWARKQQWSVSAKEKLRRRPQMEVIRQGWSWLRGMPPVKEVGGRQCDTTFAQALECMAGFRNNLGADLMFWYTGWYGPFDSGYPEFFPVAPELRGSFEDFAAEVKKNHYFVSVHTNSAEWNSGAPCFDRNLMAVWRGRYYENNYGDEHSNFVASLPLAREKWLKEYTRIAASGIPGIYYDVLGHVIAHDDNPHAGYRQDEIGRRNWTQAKVDLWRSYRDAMPQVFFQTEGNWEGAIPYLDAGSGGDTGWMFSGGRRPLPLWQLTYGDTGFFLMLYDGMGQLNASEGFAVTPLFGAVQQFPQDLWHTRQPFWLHQLARQKVSGALAATLMLAYREKDQWRLSEWENGVVAVNDGESRDGIFSTAAGELSMKQVKKQTNGAVTVISPNGFSTDGAKEIVWRGELLWKCDDNRVAVSSDAEGLRFYNPTSEELTIHFSAQGSTPGTATIPAQSSVLYDKTGSIVHAAESADVPENEMDAH